MEKLRRSISVSGMDICLYLIKFPQLSDHKEPKNAISGHLASPPPPRAAGLLVVSQVEQESAGSRV